MFPSQCLSVRAKFLTNLLIVVDKFHLINSLNFPWHERVIIEMILHDWCRVIGNNIHHGRILVPFLNKALWLWQIHHINISNLQNAITCLPLWLYFLPHPKGILNRCLLGVLLRNSLMLRSLVKNLCVVPPT